MNIALDIMGGDNAPEASVAGAVDAARAFDITVSLVGIPEVIEAELAKHDTRGLDLPIVPASQVIEMDDKPVKALRAKPDSSMVVASRLVREGEAQAFVTAGNTGGALAAGMFMIGRVKGISRPALISPFPTINGFCVMLDVGANADVRPEHLQQFAIMGKIYSTQIMGVENPSVRLLSNGEEEGKGSQLVVSAYKLLEHMPDINFQGNIEGQDVMGGIADVVVADGFTGNIFLKTAEGTAKRLQQVLFEELTSGPISTLGALLARPALRRVRERVDDSEYGGAILLGLSGIVVVGHGRSNATAIKATIRMAKQAIDHDLIGQIQKGIAHATESSADRVAEPTPEPVATEKAPG